VGVRDPGVLERGSTAIGRIGADRATTKDDEIGGRPTFAVPYQRNSAQSKLIRVPKRPDLKAAPQLDSPNRISIQSNLSQFDLNQFESQSLLPQCNHRIRRRPAPRRHPTRRDCHATHATEIATNVTGSVALTPNNKLRKAPPSREEVPWLSARLLLAPQRPDVDGMRGAQQLLLPLDRAGVGEEHQ
jgi:hypothetical protein